MSMTDWAKREVEIACKKEKPDGFVTEMNRYFSCTEIGKPDEEISHEEYLKRREMAIEKGWNQNKEDE